MSHTAQPDIFHVKTTHDGRALYNRCASCHRPIWRYSYMFIWRHGEPA